MLSKITKANPAFETNILFAVYGLPICHECAKGIIQVGIKEVFICRKSLLDRPNWYDSYLKSKEMFDEAGIAVKLV